MKKILILRLSSLGDIVLTEPIVRELANSYPDAQIDYLTKDLYLPLVSTFGKLNKVYPWKDKIKILKQLRTINYDIIIDLHAKFNTFIIKRYLNAPKIVTYNKKHLHRWLITKKISKKPIISTVSLYYSALDKIGVKRTIGDPKLTPVVKKDFFKETSDLKIGIFPGALHKTKQYPLDSFSKLISKTPSGWSCKYFLLGSKSEKKLANEIKKTHHEITNLCGKFNIVELISVIDQLDLVITNDSGPMHIAAALSIHQIAIFGSTHPMLGFSPSNKKATILSANLSCQPCSLHGFSSCPKKHFQCMNDISPETILHEIEVILLKK